MSGKSKYAVLLDELYQSVNEHLIKHFADMLQHTPSLLDVRAKSCQDMAEKELYFSLRQFLVTNSAALHHEFFTALNNTFNTLQNEPADQGEELALVSEEEMEQLISITTLHANAMNLYGEQIDHLEARLEYLEISSEYTIRKDCFNPDKIGVAFQQSIKGFPLETKLTQELFKLFETIIITKLEPMYKQINSLLIEAGIMPQILLKTSRHMEEATPEIVTKISRPEESRNPQQDKNVLPFPRGDIYNVRSAASKFMHGDYVASEDAIDLPESFKRPASQKEANGKNYYARDDVLSALSRLQNDILANNDKQQDIETIKRDLLNNMAEKEGGVASKQVKTLDERSIDFVGLMFDAITTDENIAVVIKNLLLRLQIPVIKVAMSDDRLFQHNKHPAREVLDLVTEAGKGVSDETDQIYNELEHIIDGILEEYDIDVSSFDKAVDALHELIDNEIEATQETEQREQRAIVYANARQVIVEEVKHITSQKRIPQNVMPLITKNWPSLMINRYVQHGKESWQWLESVMLMKLLIKCLQPIEDSKQWQTVWNNHLDLVDAVQEELASTKQERHHIDEQTEKLKSTFLELLDAYGFKLVEDARVTSATMFEDANAEKDAEIAASKLHAANDSSHFEEESELRSTHIEDVAQLAREKLKQLPSNVHPGVWFEIYNGEEKAIRRLKLSVVLTEVAKLVFVDRKGVKVIEKDAEVFASELGDNKSRFIADHSTFDHALGQVINALAA